MSSNCFIINNKKSCCFGCEACVQACPKSAVCMQEDEEGFRYPFINSDLCIHCGVCEKVCPANQESPKYNGEKVVFGGYHLDTTIKGQSTSGGAFSAIVEAYCQNDYVIFGSASDGLTVYHTYVLDKKNIGIFRKSKYSQSIIGSSYIQTKKFLEEGKFVLFSGTPCQIAGLRCFLGKSNTEHLLTVEVICEGVPSPLYMRHYDAHCKKNFGSSIKTLDYRFKDQKDKCSFKGRWDFQVMQTELQNGKILKQDRWYNPFWSIWLQHLMSRPSCYCCPYTTKDRVADITLGDLWGVHLYCPELYGKNGGSSLVICNTGKGTQVLNEARKQMFGHDLDFNTALKYQSPLRKTIEMNPKRDAFMKDLLSTDYVKLNAKWNKKHSIGFLLKKYFWGNRQKIWIWNMIHNNNK